MKFTKEQIDSLKKAISQASRIFIIPEKFDSPFEQKAYAAGCIDTTHEILMKLSMIETEKGEQNGT